MPASLTVQLEPLPHVPTPRHVLGAASALCESADDDHRAGAKPFAAGPVRLVPGGVGWRLGWLADEGLPPGWPPRAVRFGPVTRQVIGFGADLWPYARLACSGGVRRARLRMLTPLFFSRNGRDLPLPEPVLLVRSLLSRWNVHAPDALRIADEDARALVGGVFLGEMSGRTERVALTEQLCQVGFVGDVELRLLRGTSETAAGVFGALLRFATIAGIGAQTTWGFGAVDMPNHRLETPSACRAATAGGGARSPLT